MSEMNDEINVEAVRSVLLADGWHVVVPGSFDIGNPHLTSGEGAEHFGAPLGIHIPGRWSDASGFYFAEDVGGDFRRFYGSLGSIIALQVRT